MPTQTINIAERSIGPSGITSPQRVLPVRVTELVCEVTSSNWLTSTGIMNARIDVRIDGVWQAAIEIPDIVIGQLGRGGSMPKFSIGSGVLIPATHVRIFASCSNPTLIGLNVTATFE